MASNNRKALYIGVTNDLSRRVYEHKSHAVEGFTSKYNYINLVYFEETPSIENAISREKQLNKGSRAKKDDLVASQNPNWEDLGAAWG